MGRTDDKTNFCKRWLIIMMPFHQRMAELWTIRKSRNLSKEEQAELNMCLEANANHIWNAIKLKNLSLLASITKDYEWQHDICAKLEKFNLSPGSDSGRSSNSDFIS